MVTIWGADQVIAVYTRQSSKKFEFLEVLKIKKEVGLNYLVRHRSSGDIKKTLATLSQSSQIENGGCR